MALSINFEGNECRPLLGTNLDCSIPWSEDDRWWFRIPAQQFLVLRRVGHGLVLSMQKDYAQLLLVFVPVGLAANSLGVGEEIKFLLNWIALLSLESTFISTAELTCLFARQTVSNALTEMVPNVFPILVGAVSMHERQFELLHSFIVGLLALHLLVGPGCSFLIGSLRRPHDTTIVNRTVAVTLSQLILMSSVPFVLIAAVRETLIAYRNIPYMMKWTAIVSYVSAAILLTFQLIWLVFKYKTHASLFENSAATEEDDDTSSHHSALPGGIGITHPARAAYIVWLAIVLYLAIQCSAKLVTIQYDTFHSRAFVGGVLIPASISASGIFKTCRIAKSGQMQLVLHLTIETAIGLSFFTFPILTIVSAILALDDISQLPSTFNVILFATVFTTGIIIRDGMLTPVKGCMCLALYMIIVLNLYCHPNMVNEKP